MWEDRFGEYTQWKDDIEALYQKQGFIETFLGFQYSGIMSRNQVTNYPIQGTSFHLLLYTLIKLYKELKKRKMKTKLVAQIHDSVISDVPKKEKKEYIEIVTGIINNLHKEFTWLALPMTCDIEISKLREEGGNFGEMEKYKLAA
jgi:DNA polymerase I-like protein with 3'-5' exonuclease and polymerase domains